MAELAEPEGLRQGRPLPAAPLQLHSLAPGHCAPAVTRLCVGRCPTCRAEGRRHGAAWGRAGPVSSATHLEEQRRRRWLSSLPHSRLGTRPWDLAGLSGLLCVSPPVPLCVPTWSWRSLREARSCCSHAGVHQPREQHSAGFLYRVILVTTSPGPQAGAGEGCDPSPPTNPHTHSLQFRAATRGLLLQCPLHVTVSVVAVVCWCFSQCGILGPELKGFRSNLRVGAQSLGEP